MDVGLIGGALAAGQIRDAGAREVQPRPSHVMAELDQQYKTIAYLEEKLSMLCDKLGPIIRPSTPSDINPNKVDLENIVTLASNIREQRLKIEQLARGINSLLERIEL